MFLKLMSNIRAHLQGGTFGEFRREFIARYVPSRRVLAARKAIHLAADETR
jgi:queuine/archaeosine tRNA-ribosyltransferase